MVSICLLSLPLPNGTNVSMKPGEHSWWGWGAGRKYPPCAILTWLHFFCESGEVEGSSQGKTEHDREANFFPSEWNLSKCMGLNIQEEKAY